MINCDNWYVPVDFIKGEIVGLSFQSILFNNLLIFTENVNSKTGEIVSLNKNGQPLSHRKVAEYSGLKFTFYTDSNRLFIQGSLHKYKNNGEHNYDDFNYSNFLDVLNSLEENFGISSENILINQIEWGVNVISPVPIDRMLKSFIMHKWVRFEKNKVGRGGNYYQCEHNDYIIKTYDKSKQYKVGRDIIRIEIKQLDYASFIRKQEIGKSIKDLIDSRFKGVQETFLKEIGNILFFDPELTESKEMRDPVYWEDLNQKSRTYRKRMFDKLRNLNTEKGGNNLYKLIDKIKCKIDEVNDIEFTNYHLRYISKSLTSSLIKCLETGEDISMQKDGSSFLNVNGLRELIKKNPNRFLEIKMTYLSKRWYYEDIETQIKEIAHNIRTRFRDKSVRQKRKYQKTIYQYNLFTNSYNYIISEHYGIN